MSTAPGGGSAEVSGSSFATPLVSGTAALLWSWRPDATVAEVRDAILAGADRLPRWTGRSSSGARVNAFGALRALAAGRGEAAALPPAEPVTTTASSTSPAPRAVPLAVPVAVRAQRRRVVVALRCRARVRACTGTLAAAGRWRAFAIAARRTARVRLPARGARGRRGQRLRIVVRAGTRRRAFRVRIR